MISAHEVNLSILITSRLLLTSLPVEYFKFYCRSYSIVHLMKLENNVDSLSITLAIFSTGVPTCENRFIVNQQIQYDICIIGLFVNK